MTKLLLAVFLVPMLAVSVSVADVSGTWGMSLKADWTSIPSLACSFSQKGADLTGNCSAAGEPAAKAVNLTAGKVDGDKVTCQWNVVTPDGETWTYALAGTVDANGRTMNGTFRVSARFGGGAGEGSFAATKQ